MIARRFRALADPTRLRILDMLRHRDEASVGELTDALGTSQQNVSKHLSALQAEGFVARRKQGTSSIYRIADPAVLELCDASARRWKRSSPSSGRCSAADLGAAARRFPAGAAAPRRAARG